MTKSEEKTTADAEESVPETARSLESALPLPPSDVLAASAFAPPEDVAVVPPERAVAGERAREPRPAVGADADADAHAQVVLDAEAPTDPIWPFLAGLSGAPTDPDGSLTVEQVSEDPPEVVCPAEVSRLVLTPTGAHPAVIEGRSTPRAPRVSGRVHLLDRAAQDVPLTPPPRRRRPPRTLPARARAIAVGTLGLVVVGGFVGALLSLDPHRASLPGAGSATATAAPGALAGRATLSPLAGTAGNGAAVENSAGDPTSPRAGSSGTAPALPEVAEGLKIFRVRDLEQGEGIRIIEGKMGTHSLLDALIQEKVPQAEVFRVLRSFDDAKRFDKPRKADTFVVAFDRSSKRVKGFEYKGSPVDIWQSRENDEGRLVGAKLDLHVETRRVAKAVIVKDDLRTAVIEAGFDDNILDALDDALESRIALSRIHRGATLRILAQEERMLGKLTRYTDIEAVEYGSPKGDLTRIYHLKNGRNPGYFDAKAKASARGGWRYPVKFPRLTSRFNPKRMHPVLHVVRPHNGCDFGASTGTPIYAASKGTVEIAGPHGPSGNLVTINHGGAIVTGYAHMSRFAPGIKPGDRVEVRQLIGFVGTTGRSTGPHLHFSLKRNGVFEDPLTLKMDAERGLAPEDRDAFEALKAEMNALLDAIPLPELPKEMGSGEDDKTDEANDDNEGDGKPDAAVPVGAAASAEPGSPAAPPPKPPLDGSLDSAVWKPE